MLLLLLSTATCFANIGNKQAAIGGVGPGCTLDYVRQVYGEPDSQQTKFEDGMHMTKYYYGNSFVYIPTLHGFCRLYQHCTGKRAAFWNYIRREL